MLESSHPHFNSISSLINHWNLPLSQDEEFGSDLYALFLKTLFNFRYEFNSILPKKESDQPDQEYEWRDTFLQIYIWNLFYYAQSSTIWGFITWAFNIWTSFSFYSSSSHFHLHGNPTFIWNYIFPLNPFIWNSIYPLNPLIWKSISPQNPFWKWSYLYYFNHHWQVEIHMDFFYFYFHSHPIFSSI